MGSLNHIFVPENDSLSSFPHPDSETVPSLALGAVLIVLPVAFFVIVLLIGKKFTTAIKAFNFWALIWNLFIAQIAVQLSTEILKTYVGRPRPDMYSLCGNNTSYETCKATGSTLSDTFKSFPSGHAAGSMSALYFCAVFIISVINYDSILVSLGAMLFVLLSLWIGATRIVDYRHHADDVVAGFFIGFIITQLIWKNAKKRVFNIETTTKSTTQNLYEI